MTPYLDFYDLKKPPFEARPRGGLVLATRPLRSVLSWIEDEIEADSPILCVTGGAGVGLTSLARVLPRALTRTARVAVLSDPRLPRREIRRSITDLLSLERGPSLSAGPGLGQRLVIVVDQAERASLEFLDHLQAVLELRGPASEPLVQLILLARSAPSEGRAHSDGPLSAWLARQHAVLKELWPISLAETYGYIRRRLERAGRQSELFTEDASLVVHRHSRGVPRQVDATCHLVLREALRRCSPLVDGSLAAEALAG